MFPSQSRLLVHTFQPCADSASVLCVADGHRVVRSPAARGTQGLHTGALVCCSSLAVTTLRTNAQASTNRRGAPPRGRASPQEQARLFVISDGE